MATVRKLKFRRCPKDADGDFIAISRQQLLEWTDGGRRRWRQGRRLITMRRDAHI